MERLLEASLLLVPGWNARLLVPPLLEGLPAAGVSWLPLVYRLARAAGEALGLLPPDRVDRPKGFSEVGLEVRKLASLQDSRGPHVLDCKQGWQQGTLSPRGQGCGHPAGEPACVHGST